MGLQNNGYYNPEDYEYTRSYDVNERSAACRKKAMERIKELGVSGLFKLWTNKAGNLFWRWNICLIRFFRRYTRADETVIHINILYAGKN